MLSYHLQGPSIEFFHKKCNPWAKRVIMQAKRASPPQELDGKGRPSAGRRPTSASLNKRYTFHSLSHKRWKFWCKFQAYLRQISYISQSNLRHISDKYQANLMLILCIPKAYLKQISGKSLSNSKQISIYISKISGKSKENLRQISGIYQANVRQTLGISQANIRLIAGISQENLWKVSGKSQEYLRYISVKSYAGLMHIQGTFQSQEMSGEY